MPSTVLNIRTDRRPSLQQGQAIVLIALLILVLFGMLGLAVDSGRGYVDRRDQQAAVDAAALAAGDWYENYPDTVDLVNTVVPQSVQLYEDNLRLYSGFSGSSHSFVTNAGASANLRQDTWTYTFNGGYTLKVTATNTQFNGYQFVYETSHTLPLVFIQIFGGSPTISVGATATSIVGNQRQTPALLTLSSQACATQMKGSGNLTMLGDAYTNGTACVDANLHLAGNCYGQSGSTCSSALYYCYNGTPGFVPYPPTCNSGDVLGNPVVPAPTLPDPGYLAPEQPYYTGAGATYNRGNYIEMTPGTYANWSLSGPGCYFLDAGVYTWNGGYTSHGSMTSNELKAPHEEQWNAPGTTSQASGAPYAFYQADGCEGDFNVSVVPAPGFGIKHQSGSGKWGIELTSVRYDRLLDPNMTGNPCYNSPGCRRESAPSGCEEVSTVDTNNSGLDVNITSNAPGAQYYLVYISPNGCDGIPDDFSFVGRYLAPGWVDAGAPPATSPGTGPWSGTLVNGLNGWPCGLPTVSICGIAYNNLSPTQLCFAQSRMQLCQPPDDEAKPQCFATCPAANTVPASNADMQLEYRPYTGGDVANENFCLIQPNPGGDPNAPCASTKVTPGAVQFYFPPGQCLDQNGNGTTHVFSGEQYNWIVIYQAPGALGACGTQNLNGNAETQYIGTLYSPTQSWSILGSDTSPLAGQVICYSAIVTGSSNVGIDFNPNYAPAPPAARLIN